MCKLKSIKARTSIGKDALWISAEAGSLNTMKVLLAYKEVRKNINDAATEKVVSPIWIASQNGHDQVHYLG